MVNRKFYKYIFFLISVFSVFFSGCKEEDEFTGLYVEKENTDIAPGEYFLNLSIASSDEGASRANATYTNFAYENTILHGRAVVFQGNNEEDAFCVSWGGFPELDYPVLSSGPFTSNEIRLRNIPLREFKYDKTKKYFVLIIINANSDFVYPAEGELYSVWSKKEQNSSMVLESGTYTHPVHNKTFPAFYPTMVNATGHTQRNASSVFTPVTLVQLDNDDITNREIPETTPVKTPTIYVQRNVARIVVSPGNMAYADKEVIFGENMEFRVQVNLSNFGLEVMNDKGYPVSNISGLDWNKNYHHSGAGEYDRILWAKDPNYSETDLTHNAFRNSNLTDLRVPLYCLENTMDYDCMLQGQTTRALIKARWQYEASLPSFENKDQNATLPSECDFSVGNVFYKIDSQNYIWCRPCIEKEIRKSLDMENGDEITVDWLPDLAGGYYALSEILDVKVNGVPISGTSLNTIAKAIGLTDATSDKIGLYSNCNCYYVVRIPHFEDEDVPWNRFNEIEVKEIGGKQTRIAAYEPKHLGRYGVLRNYSYEITVNSIHSLGTPCPPEITDQYTDDMPEDLYLSIDVKVQSWNKHDVTMEF